MVYPNSYRVGMSNLGYQAILRTFLEDHRFDARRVFWQGNSLQFPDGGRALDEFDVVALSVSYQPDLVHLPRLLEAGRVAAGMSRSRPFILGGGVALTINPETAAALFDLIVLGEAEPFLPSLMESLPPTPPDFALPPGSLSQGRGVYRPGAYAPEAGRGGPFLVPRPRSGQVPAALSPFVLEDLDTAPARPAVIGSDSEFGNLYPLEVSRGCGAGCRFCAAASACGPVRFLGFEAFEREAELGLRYRKTLGLVGTAVSYHPRLEDMARYLLERGGSFSPSSIRAERVTPELAALLARGGHRTVSLAPEAGTEDLRRSVGKGFGDDVLLQKCDLLLEAGIPNLKLYFMVGLPEEEAVDVAGIVDLAVRVRERMLHHGRRRGRVGTLTVSVNPFVPKPRTPFERQPMAAESILDSRMKSVRKGLGPVGGVRVQTGSIRGAYLDALLSLGDRRVGDVLDNLPSGGVSLKRLVGIFPAAEQILFAREEGELPWSFIK